MIYVHVIMYIYLDKYTCVVESHRCGINKCTCILRDGKGPTSCLNTEVPKPLQGTAKGTLVEGISCGDSLWLFKLHSNGSHDQ